MSGVTALITSTGGNVTGDVTLASTQAGILTVSNTPTAPYTINFSPVSATVNTLNGKIGTLTLGSSDGLLNVATDPISGAINLTAYNATTNTSGIVANNISGALAWEGTGSPVASTKAYTVGALVVYNGGTYICVVAQPVGSSAPDLNTPDNWVAIGGSSAGVSSLNTQTGALVLDLAGGFGSADVTPTGNTVKLYPYFPATGTATSASLVAQNLQNNLAWQGASNVSTYAYVPGNLVKVSDITNPANSGFWVCLETQPIGSAQPALNNPYWFALGSTLGVSALSNTTTTAQCATNGDFTVGMTDSAGQSNQINLTTVLPTGGTGDNAMITLTAGDFQAGFGGQGSKITLSATNGAITMEGQSCALYTAGVLDVTAKQMVFDVNNAVRVTNNNEPAFATGNVMYFTGDWASTSGYYAGAIVIAPTPGAGDRPFVCLQTVLPSTITTPSDNPSYWTLFL